MMRRRLEQATAGAAAASALPCRARVAPDEFATLDATTQAARVKASQITPIELMDAVIARIEALNPRLDAFVTVLETAAESTRKAAELSAALYCRSD